MKTGLKSRYKDCTSAAIVFLFLLCLGTGRVMGQEPIQVSGRVTLVNKSSGDGGVVKIDTLHRPVYYGFFASMEKAEKAKANIDKVKNDPRYADSEAFRTLCRNNGVGRMTKSNGSFSPRGAYPGQVILAVTQDHETPEKLTQEYVITAGKTYYNLMIETHELGSLSIIGDPPIKKGPPFITGDGTTIFPISLSIPRDQIHKSTRIYIQPYAVDCQNEDTLSYLTSIVYEGDTYHALQDKRMGFDYFRNDSLGYVYRASVVQGFQDIDPKKKSKEKLNRNYLSLASKREEYANMAQKDTVVLKRLDDLVLDSLGKNVIVNATIKYIMPDRNGSYKGPYVCALEDYHRVYYKQSYPGTCLFRRPFKFIDFTAGLPDMELKTDFYEEAESQFQRMNGNLDLRFQRGKAELVEDSMNNVVLARVASELGAQENLIGSSVTVIAASSPEGGDKVNQDLAKKRANVARNMLSRYLPRNTSPKVDVKLYTWDDVADELDKKGRRVDAQKVRDIIAANNGNKKAIDRAMLQADFYESVIEPVLATMRMMRYTYLFEKNHVMDSQEVVESYYSNKKEYISGKRTLSSGDYYNLYNNITDSLELDTITNMAYEFLKKKDNIFAERIAPYVYNRKARMLLDAGIPDTTLLMPFIDEPVSDTIFDKRLNYKETKSDGSEVCMNFQDICITQAMNFYQLQMFGRAHKYIEWIGKMSREVPQALDKLQMYMDLMAFFGVKEDEPRFVRAKEYVLNSSSDNKAILYTEVPEWRINFDDTNDLLDLMDDGNPKKWYLKGLLWSSKADVTDGEPDLSEYYPEEGFRKLSEDEVANLMVEDQAAYVKYQQELEEYNRQHADDAVTEVEESEPVNITGVKHYLAYFHHSFQLEPTFKRLYYNEGLIDEDMRKKHKYLKKDFAAYEELFKLLKARDDENRAGLLGEVEEAEPQAGDDGSDDPNIPDEPAASEN